MRYVSSALNFKSSMLVIGYVTVYVSIAINITNCQDS